MMAHISNIALGAAGGLVLYELIKMIGLLG